MKRKLFSAILFGALLTASTSGLTSCKDYDDDISNLQSQIDKLATADQLSAKVSEMQAAISAAQSAAEAKAAAAQTVADAAKAAAADAAAAASKAQSTADAAAAAAAEVQKAADKAIADLEAKAATKDELKAAADAAAAAVKAIEDAHAADKAAIEKAIAEGLDAVKADIAKTNEELAKLATRLDAVEDKLAAIEAGEGQEEALKEIQEEVEEIADALEDIIGEYTSMVTDVSLWTSNKLSKDYALNFVYVSQEKDATFPATEGLTDAQIEFSSKNKNVMTKDSLIVRVSPTNAILAPENFSLINSQGQEISDLVEIESVKPYNKLITTKSAEGNGLYNVVFKVKEGVTPEQLVEATAVKKGNKYNQILFAVAVKNTESNDLRRVISSYDVTVAAEDYEPSRRDFQVTNLDGKWNDVKAIHNRFFKDGDKYYAKGDDPKAATPALVEGIKDYKWNNEPQVEGTEKKSSVDDEDLRYDQKLVEVAVGQSIEISVGTELVAGAPAYNNNVNATAANIKGFYVLLDKAYAIESAPTEFNMWKRYDYTNVGVPSGDSYAKKATMFYGSTGSISINSEDAEGDIIGFRVFAVNLDGTLVDPDGRAFYVQVGKVKEAVDLTNGVVVEATLDPADDSGRGSAHFMKWSASGKNYSNYSGLAVANATAFGSLTANGNVATAEIADFTNDGDSYTAGNKGWEIITNPSNYGNNTIIPVHGVDYRIDVWKYNNVNYAQVYILNPLKFIDDKTYTAKTTVYNANGTAVNDITVSFKKVIPTAAPTLSWAAGYDAAKQVFTNAANDYVILHGTAATPAAVELKTKVQGLDYGAASTDSWYTLKFQNVKSKAPSKVLAVPATNAWATDGTTANTIASAYDLKVAAKDIDAASHEIVYDYYFGEISRTYNYQTAAYSNKTTDARVTKSGAAKLAMNFGSWIDYEQIKWNGNAPTLTYAIGGAVPGAAQEIALVGSAGTGTGIYTLNGYYYKKVGNDYYQVKWNGPANEYQYVGTNGQFLDPQPGAGTAPNGGVKLTDSTGIAEVTSGGSAGKILAWNTVTGNYRPDGSTVFGVAGKEVSFGNLVPESGVGYNYICNWKSDLSLPEGEPNKWISVRFNSGTASEAFKAEYDGTNKKIKLIQQVNTANPVSEGTIYIKGADCFGHYKEWSLKVNIAH